ncbi:hypothetical protein D3C76_1845320 [compost metagenome]
MVFCIVVQIISMKSEKSGHVVHGDVPPIIVEQPLGPRFTVKIDWPHRKTQSKYQGNAACSESAHASFLAAVIGVIP